PVHRLPRIAPRSSVGIVAGSRCVPSYGVPRTAPHDTGSMRAVIGGGVSDTGPWPALGGRRAAGDAAQSCDRRCYHDSDELVLVAVGFVGRALGTV
ncbi:MAG TPA: hypothetical protein VHW04_17590, partial [Solirubrobacteraceae bacterium]|nr:hypothetical protein [Solirubrobacteraceae bacterium]